MLSFKKDVMDKINNIINDATIKNLYSLNYDGLSKAEIIEIVTICKNWLDEKSELEVEKCIECGCEIKDGEGYSSWNFGQNNLKKCEDCK